MKKLIYAVFSSLFFISTVNADSINFAVGYQENSNRSVSDPYAFKYIHDMTNQLDIDILFQGSQNRTSKSNTNQYEIGARYKIFIAKKTAVYVRGLLGSLQPSTVSDMNYAGIEVGAMSKPFDNSIGFRIDHAIMTGTNVSTLDTSLTKVWISYDVSPSNTVGIRRDFMRGDVEFDAYRLVFQHRF